MSGLGGVADAAARAPSAREEPLGPWQVALRRLRRDPIAVGSGCILLLVFVLVFAGAPLASRLLGHGPDDINLASVSFPRIRPAGLWSHVPALFHPETKTLYVLGADGPLGRDELLRLLYGGQVSLEVAFGATALALALGTLLGAIAGYFGGVVDGVVSRLTDFVMALPLLLLLIVLGTSRFGDRLVRITLGGALKPGVVSLVLLIGGFTWFYPARLARAHVLSLRQREFIEAAMMIGASDWRILRSHVLPHLVPPLLAYGAVLLGMNIILEAGVTFIGAGIRLPTSSWGSMLASTWGSFLTPDDLRASMPLRLTVIPSAAIFVTVVALNQLAEGLREAFDPDSHR